jgi:hypothetical protein
MPHANQVASDPSKDQIWAFTLSLLSMRPTGFRRSLMCDGSDDSERVIGTCSLM